MQLQLMDLIELAQSKSKLDFVSKKHLKQEALIEEVKPLLSVDDLEEIKDYGDDLMWIIISGTSYFLESDFNPLTYLLKKHNISHEYTMVESEYYDIVDEEADELEERPQYGEVIFESSNTYYLSIIEEIMKNNGIRCQIIGNSVVCDEMYEGQSFEVYFLKIIGDIPNYFKNIASRIDSDGNYIFTAFVDKSEGVYDAQDAEKLDLTQLVYELVKDDKLIINEEKRYSHEFSKKNFNKLFNKLLLKFGTTKEVIF